MPDTKALEAFGEELDKATARGSKVMPGVVAAAVDKKGKIIYSKASGFTSVLPDAASITLDSTFVVASCTKIITSIAALQCVERGLVNLDEPIDKYLPELAELLLLVTDEPVTLLSPGGSGAPPNIADISFKLGPVKNKITLRQLLTHKSGVSYDILDPRLQGQFLEENMFQPLGMPLTLCHILFQELYTQAGGRFSLRSRGNNVRDSLRNFTRCLGRSRQRQSVMRGQSF